MASVRMGSLVSDIRGSVGAETYGRNQGGIFVRERVTPSQPESSERDARQAAITAISQAWSATLTEADRSTWRQYSLQHPLPDRFGRPKSPSGICRFIKCNVQRYRTESAITATSAPADPPPPMPGLAFAVELEAAIAITGTLNPDVTGLYHLTTPYNHLRCWKLDAQERYIWKYAAGNWWYLSASPGSVAGPYWHKGHPPYGAFQPTGGATGVATSAADDADQALAVTLPPIGYDPPATDLRLFLYAGQQVTTGRNFYNTPFRYIGTAQYDGADWTVVPWWPIHWGTLTAGGRVFARTVAVLNDGATSIAGHARANT